MCWVFAASRLSPVVASGGYSSLWWLLLLQSTGSRVHEPPQLWHVSSVVAAPRLWSTGSIVVVHGLSCSTACGILLDQGWNLCLLHWEVGSLLLSHQGSPGL